MLEEVQEISLSEKKYLYVILKKTFDIIISLIAILLLIPISIFIKILYLINKDKQSIFYTQKRIGLNGKEFNFYKFRTMVPNADKVLEDLLKSDDNIRKEYEENKKLKDDHRVTKAGLILRKTSLDELQQFLKIISGLSLWCYSYPKFVYKKLFNRSYINYIFETIGYIIIFIIVSSITYIVTSKIIINNLILKLVVNSLVCLIIPSVIILLIFFKTENFKYFINIIIKLTSKIKNKLLKK